MEAIELQTHSGGFTVAWLVEVHESTYRCDVKGHRVEALRAESCLVIPRTGDALLLCEVEGQHIIIAILPRESHEETSLGVRGNLSIRVPRGGVSVFAKDEVELSSAKKLSLLGKELRVQAEEATAFLGQLAAAGKRAHLEFSRTSIVSGVIDRVAERISERVKRSFRRVEELDSLKAASIDYRAEQTVAIRSQHAFIAGKDLVKVDGEQIHFG